jgi:transcriptional regulator NrdR family protein
MKCSCGGKTQVLDRRGEYRRRECLKCKNRFSTKEIVVVRARNKTQPKKRKAPAPMAKNTREQVTKSASARRRLEEMRDNMGDGYEY